MTVLARLEVLTHLFEIKPFAASDGQKRDWIRTARSRLLVDPVRGNIKSGCQLLDGQALVLAVEVWAHGSLGHGGEFERLAAQNRAKGPGRAEKILIWLHVLLSVSQLHGDDIPPKARPENIF